MADTTINLNVTQSGQASQQMDALTKATQSAAQATQQLTAAQAQAEARNRIVRQQNETMIRESMAAQGAGQGGAGGGMGGGLMAKAGVAGLAAWGGIKAIGALAAGATNTIAARNDATLSPEQRSEKMRESLPIIGGLLKGFRELKEAADGTTNKLKLMAQHFEYDTAVIRAHNEAGRGEAANIAAQFSLKRAAYAQNEYADAKAPMAQLGAGDQSTVAGERAMEQARRRLPLEMAERQARLGKVGARADVMDTTREAEKAQQRFDQAKAAREAAIGDVQGASGKVGRRQAEFNLSRSLIELEARRNELVAARERQQASIGNAVQAESAHRKALIGIDRERLQVLVEQEQRIKGAATSFGALSEAEKTEAVEVANRAKQQGFGALTPEQKALLQRAGGGDFVQKGNENIGLRDDRFKQIQEAIGEKADLRGVQKQRVELENKIALDVQLDQKKLATDMKDQLVPVLDELRRLIVDQAKIQIQQMITNLRLKNLQQ